VYQPRKKCPNAIGKQKSSEESKNHHQQQKIAVRHSKAVKAAQKIKQK